jgi:hypothetical protein
VQRAGDVLGPSHPTTLGFAANLGLDMTAAGNVDAGHEVCARAIVELSATDCDVDERSLVAGRIESDIEPPES